ncbi:MAG: hypothetical protein WCB03_13530 [Rouxiella badensis]|uniref:hypothetical protein n=1 Tax=Rouxiella badensis TaxID=1646377 RepID=UPI0017884773|nr:hypothetical protein [Rouxiella badensis]QOI56215.1 hypothetical protein H2866_03425 [Rouxiella badensis subsp. acadiensis]
MKQQLFTAPLNGLTSAPFYIAANCVLNIYDLRQEHGKGVCDPNTPAEIEWAAEQLNYLAGVAAYTGSREAIILRNAADIWKRYARKPDLFPVEIEV